MKIEKKSVISDRVSCNFCKKGQLGKDGKSLVYPYDELFMFVAQDGGIAPCICQDCLDELFEKTPRATNDDLEKAAREELIHSYATCVDGELAYQRNAMLNMFRKGAQWQLANMWVPVEERLPVENASIFFMVEWRGYSSECHKGKYYADGTFESDDRRVFLSTSKLYKVIAWMLVPEFKKGE